MAKVVASGDSANFVRRNLRVLGQCVVDDLFF